MADTDSTEEELTATLSRVLLNQDVDLDDDLVAYISGMLSAKVAEDPALVEESIDEVLIPFLDSVQCPPDLMDKAKEAVWSVLDNESLTDLSQPNDGTAIRKLQQGIVNMSMGQSSVADRDATRHLWGMEQGIKAMANDLIDAHDDKTSMRDKRKQRKLDAQQQRKLLSSASDRDTDQDEGLVHMNVRAFTANQTTDKTRDVNVRNVSVSLNNGTILLESGELKLAYQRRYGLIGENGVGTLQNRELWYARTLFASHRPLRNVGKSTLLKAIAQGDIEGFPEHLRVLHVRQEVPAHLSDTITVLDAVLKSDLERNMLLDREKELVARLEQSNGSAMGDDDAVLSVDEKRKKLTANAADLKMLESDLKELDALYARLQVLSADSAEARAVMILSGLQFTTEMQQAPIASLSGGWRMRVALAAALFIEPDLLMLGKQASDWILVVLLLTEISNQFIRYLATDEPSNHLDVMAVLWLESYLVNYSKTVLIVSHDRSLLDEVCTDIIEFKKKKLTYYRGNFGNYVRLRDENIRNAMRLYSAYHEKREHMMEFINTFRANAKRATMVQSRIKAVEKMDAEAPEAVEVDPVWRFSIPNSEPLGPPIIAVNDVSFDYNPICPDGTKKPESEYLLRRVNFGVDLTSRIAILGANGQGK
jgi:ATP-binding cassette, subfamily F, member 3